MSSEKTHKSVEEILNNFPKAKRDMLIPILQAVQEKDGYLSKASMTEIANYLSIPVSKVYGVATFYNQFRFKPVGKYAIQVCRGTACHVQGSKTILEVIENELKISAGDTSKDGLFSIEVVACIGACGLAPVISINGEFFAKLTSDKVRSILGKLKVGNVQNSEVKDA